MDCLGTAVLYTQYSGGVGPPNALGRNGAAIEHLLQCPVFGVPALCSSELWSDPVKAVEQLARIYSSAMATGKCAIQRPARACCASAKI